jgi:PAS domain S-box-containing protein
MTASNPATTPAPHWRRFATTVVSPAILTFALFLGLIFAVVIPTMRDNIIERKREMIRELTQAAWSELADLEARERAGLLTRQGAQAAAVARIQSMRYGDDGKDYFWVTDLQPRMIVHPYRPELNGQDLSEYSDRAGKRLFVESAKLVRAEGAGYLEYLWQWKDDEQRIVPKLSYVKGFQPWGWIIGTGIYLEDVRTQVAAITRRVIRIALGFSMIIAGLLAYMTKQSLNLERQRFTAEAGLRESEEKYRTLVEGTTEGIVLVVQGHCAYGNGKALSMLGYQESGLQGLEPARLFDPVPDFLDQPQGPSPGQRVQAIRRDGSRLDVLVGTSPVAVGDRTGLILSIKDMTAHATTEETLSRLLAEMQTTQLLPTRPVSASRLTTVACGMDTPIKTAAAAMTRARSSAVIVQAPTGGDIGIVTDEDLRTRVVAAGEDTARPISGIMSAPLVRISGDALLFEAARDMRDRGIQHLVVTDQFGSSLGVLTAKEILQAQQHSVSMLQAEIRAAATVDELREIRAKLPFLVKSLLDGGTRVEHVTRVMTAVSDDVLVRLVEMALQESGPPPVRFAFVVLGSEARGEQTLKTDQDNAIIFDDAAADGAGVGSAQACFLRLGERVCADLDAVGYTRCKGEVMASNPKWCKPLSAWRDHVTRCVTAAEDQDLHDMNVLFDFRCAYGELSFAAALREHLHGLLAAGQPAFFFHLAQTTLQFKPPLGFFGNIQLESGGEHPSSVNIKNAITPVVNFARIYALSHQLEETNTFERLRRLLDRGVLLQSSHDELAQAFTRLMQIRLAHQAEQACAGAQPDNYIHPGELTHLERSLLKKVFSDIGVFQSRLRTDFARTA